MCEKLDAYPRYSPIAEHLMTRSRNVIPVPATPELIMRTFFGTKSGIICLDWRDWPLIGTLWMVRRKTVTCILNRWLVLALYVSTDHFKESALFVLSLAAYPSARVLEEVRQ